MNKTTAQVEAVQDEAPLPDEEWKAKWAAVAKDAMPTPDEWADAIIKMLWVWKLESDGYESSRLPDRMTACAGSLQSLLNVFLPSDAINGAARASRLALMNAGVIAPLMRLHSAINELETGAVSPLFQPRKMRRNPGKGNVDDFLKAMAARALEEFQKAGIPQNEAAQQVADGYNEGLTRNMRAAREATPDTIINWRENMKIGKGRASAIAIRHFKEPLPEEWGTSHKARGDGILTALRARLWIRDL
jgi:hypothetical protein